MLLLLSEHVGVFVYLRHFVLLINLLGHLKLCAWITCFQQLGVVVSVELSVVDAIIGLQNSLRLSVVVRIENPTLILLVVGAKGLFLYS